MKKGVNKFENQGEKWFKLLQKCQMTDGIKEDPMGLENVKNGGQ